MDMAQRIRRKLNGALAPTRLEIRDDSERHRGHAGAGGGGESHFEVTVVSAAFEGQSQVARHRLIYGLLADELAAGVHALGLRTLSPAEDR
jgi:BolA protein